MTPTPPEHWMLIPMSVAIPAIILMLILAHTYRWSPGAQGTVVVGILAITAAVGSLLAPLEYAGAVAYARSMRVAVFSDVHADARTLHALLREFASAEIRIVWCLGDFASGDREPAECFDLTLATAQVVLVGNHERFVLERVWQHLRSGWALYAQLAHHQLGRERLERLAALRPHVIIPELGVELAHGSLTDHWNVFVDEDSAAYLALQLARQPLVLVGHTHDAAFYREPAIAAVPECEPIELEHEYVLDRQSVLNPGAERDGPGARWLELALDAERRSATWHRVEVEAEGSPASRLEHPSP